MILKVNGYKEVKIKKLTLFTLCYSCLEEEVFFNMLLVMMEVNTNMYCKSNAR